MRYMGFILALALPTWSPLAQESAEYRACSEKARTQAQMNACANEEATRADADLSRAYDNVLSKAESDPEAVAKIKALETAWTAYRDAYIEATYPARDKQAEYGSVYPMEVDILRAKLTRQQIAAVKDLLQHYGN